jgi:hypothetical protein
MIGKEGTQYGRQAQHGVRRTCGAVSGRNPQNSTRATLVNAYPFKKRSAPEQRPAKACSIFAPVPHFYKNFESFIFSSCKIEIYLL